MAGATGPRGPSAAFAFSNPGPIQQLPADSTTVGALNALPAGRYVISAKVQFDFQADAPPTSASCTLSVTDLGGTVDLDSSAATLTSPSSTTLPWLGFADLPTGGDVTLACVAEGMDASNIKLSAIQVETLTVQP